MCPLAPHSVHHACDVMLRSCWKKRNIVSAALLLVVYILTAETLDMCGYIYDYYTDKRGNNINCWDRLATRSVSPCRCERNKRDRLETAARYMELIYVYYF